MNWLAMRRFYWRLQARKNKMKAHPILQCWDNENIDVNAPWQDVEYCVIDIEASSLNPHVGEILSIAWVIIADGKIRLDRSAQYYVKPKYAVGDSATVHQIRDCELHDGISRHAMFTYLFQAANNRVLVFHHAPFDMGYLHKFSFYEYGLPMLWPVADTLRIEKKRLEQKSNLIRQNALRLASCRARYNLPRYPAHNALHDALATAELFIAQCRFIDKQTTVKSVL